MKHDADLKPTFSYLCRKASVAKSSKTCTSLGPPSSPLHSHSDNPTHGFKPIPSQSHRAAQIRSLAASNPRSIMVRSLPVSGEAGLLFLELLENVHHAAVREGVGASGTSTQSGSSGCQSPYYRHEEPTCALSLWRTSHLTAQEDRTCGSGGTTRDSAHPGSRR